MLKRLRASGLFVRFLTLCVSITAVVLVLTIAALHAYQSERDSGRHAAELANLARSIAPVVERELAEGRPRSAERALRVFAGVHYVICADFMYGDERRAAWPSIGCDIIQGEGDKLVLPLASKNGVKTSIAVRINTAILQRHSLIETAIFTLPLLSVVIIIFVVLSAVFRTLVLVPLDLLKMAMVASTPRGPVRAQMVHSDEIGALVRVYNKLVAGSRLYIRRLDQSQSNLETSEQRFRSLAEVSGDWFFEMDADLRITYISESFYQLTGIEPENIIGKSRDDLALTTTKSPHWARHIESLKAHQEFKRFEYQLQGGKGQAFDITISGVPLFDEAGVFIGYRGIGTDVSAIKEKERQLAETNRNFGDSVTYASSIQRGLLANAETVSAHLGTARAVWQPKDLVGGDFYWVRTIADIQYLVFFDCTGHGVPGAFMTLITTAVLDQIAVSSATPLLAEQILQAVHDGVCRSLGITREKPGMDGLDCAVIRLDRAADRLEFAGASIDLYQVTPDGATTRHRGARTTLGYKLVDEPLNLSAVALDVGQNSFVVTTDGLLTQIGESTGRVLGTRRFELALGEVEDNAPAKLVRAIARLLKNWQGREERRDDISFIAFKPNES